MSNNLPAPHPVTQFNSGQPLRDRRPADLVHPNLRDVKFSLHAHEVCGIIDATILGADSASDNNRKKFLQSNQSIELIESDQPATPSRAASRNGDDCICLTYIGDHGSCPVHGDGPK